jgi:hypothetical protein
LTDLQAKRQRNGVIARAAFLPDKKAKGSNNEQDADRNFHLSSSTSKSGNPSDSPEA